MTNFKLFANCIAVKGAKKYVVYDLQRNQIHPINEGIFEIVTKYKKFDIDTIKKIFENQVNRQIDEQLQFLVEKELGFYCDSPVSFPEIDFTWESPSIITNCIVEINNDSIFSINSLLIQLSNLNCKYLEIRCYHDISEIEFNQVVSFLEKTTLVDVTFMLKYSPQIEKFDFDAVVVKEQRIGKIIIHSSPFNKTENCNFFKTIEYNYVKKSISNSEIGIIKVEYLTSNLRLYSESQKYNSYFNRKLFVGTSGVLKNAPECEEEFGFIQELKKSEELIEIISHSEFQKYWLVSPDMIDITKDSEYRYAFVDNRIPHQRKDGSWYYKEECNYNPYISKWRGEEGYKTLEECGVISNEKTFSINHDKIAAINKDLWDE